MRPDGVALELKGDMLVLLQGWLRGRVGDWFHSFRNTCNPRTRLQQGSLSRLVSGVENGISPHGVLRVLAG